MPQSKWNSPPRDITSRAITLEIRAGRGIHADGSAGGASVYLDLRHMGKAKIMSRVPFCWEEAHRLVGVDAVHEPIRYVLLPIIRWGEFPLIPMDRCAAAPIM